MAGDWIKVEKATARKPEVLQLAELLSVHPDHAFGMCVRFWCWCDDHMVTGHAPRVTDVTLDTCFGRDGFASALLSVGWLRVRDGSLEVPNFERHLSESAKARALSGERKRRQRGKKVSRTKRDKCHAGSRTPLLFSVLSSCVLDSGEEVPERLRTEQFRETWNCWVRHRSEIKKPLKPTQVRAQLQEMDEMGVERSIAAIRFTIRKGWQGLREPDSNGSRPQQEIEF